MDLSLTLPLSSPGFHWNIAMFVRQALAIVVGLMTPLAVCSAGFFDDEQKTDTSKETIKPKTVVKKELTVDGHYQELLTTVERFQAAVTDKKRDRTQWSRYPLQLRLSLTQLRKRREQPETLKADSSTKTITPKPVQPTSDSSPKPLPTKSEVTGTETLRKPDRDKMKGRQQPTLRDVPLEWIQRHSKVIEKKIDEVVLTLDSPELDHERLTSQVKQLDCAIRRLAKPEPTEPPKEPAKSEKPTVSPGKDDR